MAEKKSTPGRKAMNDFVQDFRNKHESESKYNSSGKFDWMKLRSDALQEWKVSPQRASTVKGKKQGGDVCTDDVNGAPDNGSSGKGFGEEGGSFNPSGYGYKYGSGAISHNELMNWVGTQEKGAGFWDSLTKGISEGVKFISDNASKGVDIYNKGKEAFKQGKEVYNAAKDLHNAYKDFRGKSGKGLSTKSAKEKGRSTARMLLKDPKDRANIKKVRQHIRRNYVDGRVSGGSFWDSFKDGFNEVIGPALSGLHEAASLAPLLALA